MAIKVYKPTGNARRQMSVVITPNLSKARPVKGLISIIKKTGGRNSQGKITVRHHGGGAKQFYRIVDFKRDKFNIPATVKAIEYDPNRTANIALLYYKDGEKRYIIAPAGLNAGDSVISSKESVKIQAGNCTKLENIPVGSLVHNVELSPGLGAKLVRTAGAWAKLMAIEGKYAQLKMPSTEVRLVDRECLATIGEVGNSEKMHVKIGKAGRMRHMGVRPTVRGKAMNPVDHPHGGGEGSNPIGLKHPKTPWGKPALGVLTRKKKKQSNKFIVRKRQNKRLKK
ncbi:MAG: 50S ribosomal protein L2 [Parcubacteria group bacterium GW2011_GWC2_38_7]|nr:MAG: 50S ribosomal protein L2 [Parcubacteria group bacterium GW2011_GWC2_38_7]